MSKQTVITYAGKQSAHEIQIEGRQFYHNGEAVSERDTIKLLVALLMHSKTQTTRLTKELNTARLDAVVIQDRKPSPYAVKCADSMTFGDCLAEVYADEEMTVLLAAFYPEQRSMEHLIEQANKSGDWKVIMFKDLKVFDEYFCNYDLNDAYIKHGPFRAADYT